MAGAGAVVGAASDAIGGAIKLSAAKKEARRQRNFIREQRSTAYQVQRTDLESAGYNPLYAFQGGQGAATLGSQQADLSGISDIAGGIGGGYGQYLENKLIKAQKRKALESAAADRDAASLSREKAATEKSTRGVLEAQTSKIAAETLNLGHTKTILGAEASAAETMKAIEDSGFGEATRWMKRAIETINPFKDGFGKAKR